MIIYQGEDLQRHITEVLSDEYRERFLMRDLDKYINSKNSHKLCCLFGLRRTGKTTMMLQEISKLDAYDRCLLLECEDNDSMYDLIEVIAANSDCRYVFIDEVTKAKEFINTCSVLADRYASEGIKIVLTGTDSLGFFLAKHDELYDRVHVIHTTYISFSEYNFLLEKDIRSYIEFGGTLTANLKEENVFCNNDTRSEYANTAIVYNIVRTLNNWKRGVNYANRILGSIVERDELPAFINKVIELTNRLFLARIIEASLKSHTSGSLASDIDCFFSNKADERATDTIIQYLESMDVLYQIPQNNDNDFESSEFIFTQPGMRYCQATALAEAFIMSSKLKNYTMIQRHQILEELTADICDGILQDIVLYQIAQIADEAKNVGRNLYVTKHLNIKNDGEDIFVADIKKETILVLASKLSSVQTDEQIKHLNNAELSNEIEKVTGCTLVNWVVLYNGENADYRNVLYINVEEFLKKPAEALDILLREKVCAEIFEERLYSAEMI